MIGGRDIVLIQKLTSALQKAGFHIRACREGLDARSFENLVNRGRSKKGVQLEISKGLREELSSDIEKRRLFVTTIQEVLFKYL
jgi:phage replication-related protein YjqB (UPF0714/DUF867 family)